MNNEILATFIESAKKRTFEKNQVIVPADSRSHILYYMIEGAALVYQSDSFGHIMAFERIVDGKFFGETCFLSPNQSTNQSLRAVTECEFAFMDYAKLSEFIIGHPEFRELLIQEAINRSLFDRKNRFNMATMDVIGRLGIVLLDFTKHPDAIGSPDGVKISKMKMAELAALVGCTREIIGRTLKLFEEQGLISVQRKHVLIVGS